MNITLEIPDGYSDVLSVTCIGLMGSYVNVKTHAILITGHDGDTYVVPIVGDNTKPNWKK